MPDWTEQAMSGLDQPRPLTDDLARCLERSLQAASGARALGDHLSSRLESALSDSVGPLLEDLSQPRPLEPHLRRRLEEALARRGREETPARRRPRPVQVWSAAAAIAVLAAAGTALGLAASRPAGSQASALSGAGVHRAAGAPAANGTSNFAPSASGGVGAVGGANTPVPASTLAGPMSVSSGAAASSVGQPPGASPVVSALSPPSGPAAGGTWVVVSGSGLAGATAVDFGGVPAVFTVVSDDALRVESPPHAAGSVDVRVTTGGGTSPLSSGDRFTYG
ncbi:MAG TPA: IPT/TIG domain-containing protein [Acidimicrobiales bacterium]|nr:IPT/TIG domain-containing protein [Acidimicrobiales bacterium]